MLKFLCITFIRFSGIALIFYGGVNHWYSNKIIKVADSESDPKSMVRSPIIGTLPLEM